MTCKGKITPTLNGLLLLLGKPDGEVKTQARKRNVRPRIVLTFHALQAKLTGLAVSTRTDWRKPNDGIRSRKPRPATCRPRGATSLRMGRRRRRGRAMLFNRLWTLHHAPGRDSPRRSSPRKHDGPKRSAGGAKPPASRNHEGAGQPTSRSHGGAQRPKRGAQRPKRGAQGTHPTHVCATGRLNHAGAATSLPPPSCFPPHPARRHQRDAAFAHGLRRRRPGGESSPRAIPGHLGGKIPVPRPSFHQPRIPRQKTRHHPVLPPAQIHRGFLSVTGSRFNYRATIARAGGKP